jgi:hypothetical protein
MGVWDVSYPLVMSEQSMLIEMDSSRKVGVEYEDALDVDGHESIFCFNLV